ncbi:hypothetical protein ACIF6H_12095 [Streptomyces microflavus]|uniref:hypothetical protein n=1 Tax=Streptomyces microflavus TaxID=1919 RepID=UPI0037D18E28
MAMPKGGRTLASFLAENPGEDYRDAVTSQGGGTWGVGHLFMTLSSKPGRTLILQDIRPATPVPKTIDPPAWYAETQAGCGDTYGRVFDFNLDKPNLIDRGVIGERGGEEEAPSNPLGPGFTVSSEDPAIVRVDVSACEGNYEWSLRVRYSEGGQKYSEVVGPFRTMSVPGKETVGYVPNPNTGQYGKDGTKLPAPQKACQTG